MLYKHLIKGMIAQMEEDGAISPKQRRAVKKSIKQFWADKIADVWTTEDVKDTIMQHLLIENRWMIIDQADLQKVLDYMQDHLDSNYGYSYESVLDAIEEVLDVPTKGDLVQVFAVL